MIRFERAPNDRKQTEIKAINEKDGSVLHSAVITPNFLGAMVGYSQAPGSTQLGITPMFFYADPLAQTINVSSQSGTIKFKCESYQKVREMLSGLDAETHDIGANMFGGIHLRKKDDKQNYIKFAIYGDDYRCELWRIDGQKSDIECNNGRIFRTSHSDNKTFEWPSLIESVLVGIREIDGIQRLCCKGEVFQTENIITDVSSEIGRIKKVTGVATDDAIFLTVVGLKGLQVVRCSPDGIHTEAYLKETEVVALYPAHADTSRSFLVQEGGAFHYVDFVVDTSPEDDCTICASILRFRDVTIESAEGFKDFDSVNFAKGLTGIVIANGRHVVARREVTHDKGAKTKNVQLRVSGKFADAVTDLR